MRTYLVTPIVNTILIINLLAQSTDDRAGTPLDTLFFLLLDHLVQNGHNPVFKCTVIRVGNEQISYPVQPVNSSLALPPKYIYIYINLPLLPQSRPIQMKVSQDRLSQTFYKIFLHTPGRCHKTIHEPMLSEKLEDFTET